MSHSEDNLWNLKERRNNHVFAFTKAIQKSVKYQMKSLWKQLKSCFAKGQKLCPQDSTYAPQILTEKSAGIDAPFTGWSETGCYMGWAWWRQTMNKDPKPPSFPTCQWIESEFTPATCPSHWDKENKILSSYFPSQPEGPGMALVVAEQVPWSLTPTIKEDWSFNQILTHSYYNKLDYFLFLTFSNMNLCFCHVCMIYLLKSLQLLWYCLPKFYCMFLFLQK